MWFVRSALPALLLFACGGTSSPRGPEAVPDDFPDELPGAAAARQAPARSQDAGVAPAPDGSGAAARAVWNDRVVVAGHASARFRFSIPAGLVPLRGVADPPEDPREAIELASAGPEGVGVADGATVALNSILVFSDPLGVGEVFTTLDDAAQDAIAARYATVLRATLPDAQDPVILQIGGHLALRIELPRVAMEGRPVRHGRHYLIFDELATASVDCLWTEAEAVRMAAACDAVAAGLERVDDR